MRESAHQRASPLCSTTINTIFPPLLFLSPLCILSYLTIACPILGFLAQLDSCAAPSYALSSPSLAIRPRHSPTEFHPGGRVLVSIDVHYSLTIGKDTQAVQEAQMPSA